MSNEEAKSVANDPNDWTINGNSNATSSSFLGTTNYQPLKFRTNNTERAYFDANGTFFVTKDAVINGVPIGRGSGFQATNIRVGNDALRINTTGVNNTAIGPQSLYNNTSGSQNQAIGNRTLLYNTSGGGNFAMGYEAMRDNSTGAVNVAIGTFALYKNVSGDRNVAIGYKTAFNNRGENNTAIGLQAAYHDGSGSNSVNIGFQAGYGLSTNNSTSHNTFIGAKSGYSTNGNYNVFIGNEAGYNYQGSNQLFISNSNTNNPLIRGEFDNKIIRINVGTSNSNTQGYFAIGDFDASSPITIKPGYRLIVQDGIITEKLKIALKTSGFWADYVFDPNYKLMPLEEVDSFIRKEKHLPNVPSAADVLKDGIDIALMNAKLLEKIEELTLYVIMQQKQLDEQSKKIDNL